MTKLIDLIAGARPNFMKIAPIIAALRAAEARGGHLSFRLVHTGQHYDRAMSGDFFEQLGIPDPDVNLEVGSGTQAEQTAEIMIRYERVLSERAADLCLVVGDVTSTMACAITARKMHVPVAHVEGGIRSGDWAMPEEINRVVTDSITNWFFTTSQSAGENLCRAGVSGDRIFFVGNTMIDTLFTQMPHFRKPAFWDELGLRHGEYCVVTLHRPANVDREQQLVELLQALSDGLRACLIVFPVHPRTAKVLRGLDHKIERLHCVDPQPYLEFNYLVKHCRGVVTDSGGVTEETTVMGVPCITLRNNTERPETVTLGTNELVGTNPANLKAPLARLMSGTWKKGAIPEKWDGHAAERTVEVLERLLSSK